nr:immunoglobulin heavy chain junction region [Mus musculus]
CARMTYYGNYGYFDYW